MARFAGVVGEGFRAPMMVAALNAALTGVCLRTLGVNGKALLRAPVFLRGRIPVLCGFALFVLIFLMAANGGGIGTGRWLPAMGSAIALLETYIFNLRIFSPSCTSTRS